MGNTGTGMPQAGMGAAGGTMGQGQDMGTSKEYLVEGAKLVCVNGSCITQLKLTDSHHYTSGGKRKANCRDCKACDNIPYFGKCRKNEDTQQCQGFMDLADQWVNTAVTTTKAERVDGEDAITMTSVLLCKKGGIIMPLTSGQGYDGAVNWAAFLDRYQKVARWAAGKNLLCHVFGKDPINMNTGNFIYEKEDLVIEGSVPLSFKLSYNAMDCGDQGVLGEGWSHNYGVCLRKIVGEDLLAVVLEDGREVPYRLKLGDEYAPVMGDCGTLRSTEEGYVYENAGMEYKFDKEGKLRHQTGRNGSCWTFSYNTRGLLVGVDNGNGGRLCYTYNEERNLISVSDHTGRKVSLVYQYGKLRWFTSSSEGTYTFEYNENGKLDGIITPKDILGVKNEYDGADRVVKQTLPDGGVVELRYDDKNNRTYMKEQNGNLIIYECDEKMRNIRTIYEDGEESFAYNDRNQKIRYMDKNGNTTRYSYDDRGNLTQVIDGLGQRTSMTYDKSDHLISIKDSVNGQVRCRYDKDGNCIEIINQLGVSKRFSYRDIGLVNKILLPDESEINFQYDCYGNVIKVINERNIETMYKYDLSNRMIESVDGIGNVTKYEYDNQNNIIGIMNAAGKRRSYIYNEKNLISIIDFDGSRESMEYDNSNKPFKHIDQEGNATLAQYNTMGFISEKTFPNGRKIKFTYNHLNQLISMEEEGSITSYKYDRNGNRTKVIEPSGNETTFTYDALNRNTGIYDSLGPMYLVDYNYQGKIAKITDKEGRSITADYDLRGRKIRETDVYGRTITYIYNEMDLPIKIIDVDGLETACYYYPGGLLKRIEYMDGTSENFKYDSNDNIIEKSYQNGYTLKYEYDSLNQLISITSDIGEQMEYEYDDAGNIIAVRDGKGNQTYYKYSPTKNLVGVIDAMGNETKYDYNNMGDLIALHQYEGKYEGLEKEYDKIIELNNGQQSRTVHSMTYKRDTLGRLKAVTDALGNTNTYQYDEGGNLVSVKDADGYVTKYEYNLARQPVSISFGESGSTKFVYDLYGNLKEISDNTGITKIDSDIYGRTTRTTDPEGNEVTYEYNANNQREMITYPDGKRVRYMYDQFHRLSEINGNGWSEQFHYDSDGNLARKEYGNSLISRYNYDKAGRLSHFVHLNHEDVLDEYKFIYDIVGNKTNVTRFRRGVAGRNDEYEYRYDELNRLVGAERKGAERTEYVYDSFGNRTLKVFNGYETLYTYNSANQLIKEEGSSTRDYSYDKRGNLKSIKENGLETCRYEFGPLNRLTGLSNQSGEKVAYDYNGLGFRVGKKERNASGSSETIKFVVDVTKGYNNLLRTETSTGGQDYIWDNGIIGALDKNGKRYYLLDDLGSPIRYIADNGRILESYDYDEFGASMEGVFTETQPFGFTGYIREEGGDYFAQARDYMPRIGRFISKDAFGGSQGIVASLNRYSYCFENPERYVDLFGYFSSDEGIEAHKVLQNVFLGLYPGNGQIDKRVTGYPYSPTGVGKIDLYLSNNGRGQIEIYEIKPISQYHHKTWWQMLGEPTGVEQREGYIEALHSMKIKNINPSGTTFNPNGWTMPCPSKPGTNIRYYTFHDEPGMIYWGYVKQPKPEPIPVQVPQTEWDKEAVRDGVLAGAEAGIGAYLLYRAIRLLPSLAFPPSIPFNLACP